MPVQFQPNEDGIRELEISANLPAESISHVTWLKNPAHRSSSQNYANVKIYCRSATDANTLILGSGRISHMGSQLRIHKDIRSPGTCNRCQKYGHFAQDCKEEDSTCAKCGDNHRTTDCATGGTKCTPCGSTEHRTNDENCPERIERENAIINKNPETLTPYYITDERWTGGLPDNSPPGPTTLPEGTQQNRRPYVINTRHGRTHPRIAGRATQQRTLTSSGFQRKSVQTGTNNIPLGNKNPRDETSSSLSLPRQTPPDAQQNTATQHVQSTQPTSSQS